MSAAASAIAHDIRPKVEQYLRADLDVVPVEPRSKKIRIKNWETKKFELSDFRAENNVGIRLGKDGLADVDLDCPEAISVATKLLPRTGFVYGRASARASHHFYRVDPPVKSIKLKDPTIGGNKGTLVELRCLTSEDTVGYQSVAPGSIHEDTGEFIDFEPGANGIIANVDAEDLMMCVHRIGAAALLARHWPPKGSRHETMMALAGCLARLSWAEAAAFRFCDAVYRSVPTHDRGAVGRVRGEVESTFAKVKEGGKVTGIPTLKRAIPANVVDAVLKWLDLDEILTEDEGALHSSDAPPACVWEDFPTLAPAASNTVDHANVAEMPRHPKASQRPQLQPVKTVTGLEILKKEFPPPVFLFEGLLHNGVTLLCGRPKVGKSWLALQLAIDAACGRPAMTKFQNFGHAGVLYAALEEPESRTNARLKKFIGPELEVYADNIRFLYQLEPLSRGGIAQLDQALTLVPTRLLIVDTFMAAQRTERKANADIFAQDYNAVKELQNLAYKHEIALVMVHHTRKQSSDNPLDEVAGTTGITAGADSIWVLRKTAQGIILSIQGRDMADREIELGFSEDPEFFGWSVRAQGAEVGLSDARREIIDVLKGPPLSPKEIAQCFPNRSEKTVRNLLDRMVKAGSIVRAGAKYAAEPVPFEVTQ